MIVLDNITKHIGNGFAVHELSLNVSKGATLALFGPSGCGKTTTMRMIAGFEKPDYGRILIAGKTVSSSRNMTPPHRRGVGMVFQDLALWPHLTVRRHLNFVLDGRIKNRHLKAEKIEHMLARVALSGKIDAYPHQLSGGEKQRLAMARALIVEPAVLLMDEPLSNLDAHLRSAILRDIRELIHTLGMTTIYVTHDWHEAVYLSDEIALMQNGRIIKTVAADDDQTGEEYVLDLKPPGGKTATLPN